MKPAYEVWLEIVRERLLEGDSAVIAINRANQVTAAYEEKFSKKYEEPISALDSGYVSGDPNAR